MPGRFVGRATVVTGVAAGSGADLAALGAVLLEVLDGALLAHLAQAQGQGVALAQIPVENIGHQGVVNLPGFGRIQSGVAVVEGAVEANAGQDFVLVADFQWAEVGDMVVDDEFVVVDAGTGGVLDSGPGFLGDDTVGLGVFFWEGAGVAGGAVSDSLLAGFLRGRVAKIFDGW